MTSKFLTLADQPRGSAGAPRESDVDTDWILAASGVEIATRQVWKDAPAVSGLSDQLNSRI